MATTWSFPTEPTRQLVPRKDQDQHILVGRLVVITNEFQNEGLSHGCPLKILPTMPTSDIVIKGAREHNLRSIDLVLPRNKLICLTGVSGSGKSSLAFDTLYAEGQRRYVESLSSFARQFLGQMPKPDVDYLGGLSPSISISQKSTGSNPRSTVGTVTEIYDYLRVLFARVGQGHCPQCGRAITAQSREQILARILQLSVGTKFSVLAPIIRGQKGEYRDLFEDLLKQGFVRARVNGETLALTEDPHLDRRMKHSIEVVVDRLAMAKGLRSRLAESIDLALKVGKGNLIIAVESENVGPLPPNNTSADGEPSSKQKPRRRVRKQSGDVIFSVDYACTSCGISFEPPSPQLFSFNSPQGMCYECDGLGQLFSFDADLLVPDASLSFKQGSFELIGTWSDIGRWRRHIYQGVADTIERIHKIPKGSILESPWSKLDESLKSLLLWGTGEQHITYTWRGGSSPTKYGGTFDGIIPELLSKYRNCKSKPLLRKLERYMRTIECPDCHGERLTDQARNVYLTSTHPRFSDAPSRSLPEVCQLAVSDAVDFFSELKFDSTRAIIAEEVLKEIRGRLGFLMNVGLDYLSLDRTAPTLSGGESQRIRLAGQIGSGLVGVLYILDEPSIGLHPRDNHRLLETLLRLRNMGNTVVVVEHDEDTMRAADHVIDFGPGPGVRGGEVVVAGPPAKIAQEKRSLTGQFLSGQAQIEVPPVRRGQSNDLTTSDLGSGTRQQQNLSANSNKPSQQDLTPCLRVLGARHNNLKEVDVEIPLGRFVCITGVSGSGKSSLVNDILVEALRRDLNRGEGSPGEHQTIEGLEHLDKLISIDQTPIGRTPRSNPGTYIKVFDDIRALFAQLSESKRRGYKPGRFSFNVSGGRCEACEGNGSNKLEMDFLADVWVTCPVCEGHRYNRETLQVKFKERTIAEVLEMDIQQLLVLFENQPKIHHKLKTLHAVGLDYLKLGQPSPTLSGGEAQRIKLARELVKKSTGKTLYLLDEPTTGLHFADVKLLLTVLHNFADAGNTVLVVEHNLDVVKTADWIIDIGPEGGDAGGHIVASGTPEEVATNPHSHTGRCLRPSLGLPAKDPGNDSRAARESVARDGKSGRRPKNGYAADTIRVQGAKQHNLKSIDAKIQRDKMTVFCGPSGSGKTSLAMDTIYAEGQRRYVESLSSYARQFVSQMQKPAMDHIDGLSPAIAIEQKNLGHTPRSTVGTVTEIYDYFRILFARLGTAYCADCDIQIGTQTADQIIDKVMGYEEGQRLYLMAPIELDANQRYESLWEEIRSAGYIRIRIDGKTYSVDEPPKIDRRRKHQIDVVVDRAQIKQRQRSRIADSVENALALGKGVLRIALVRDNLSEDRWEVITHSQHMACDRCGRSYEPLTPHNFSFNSHLGWCDDCEGLGTQVGANPAALMNDPKLTLSAGAVSLWPDVGHHVSQLMLNALSRETGLPIDTPFDQLTSRQRRLIMHGTGEQWIDVKAPLPKRKTKKKRNDTRTEATMFRYQFKGIYPALEEASRLSPSFRARLERFVDEVECSSCSGSRLRDDSSAARFRGHTIDDWCRMPLGKLQQAIKHWKLNQRERRIAGELIREISNRVDFLNEVGLDYLSLARGAATLSNGEAQRIRLGSQLGSGLCGVLYVLDEPTIGLHPRDNHRLLTALHKLRDLGNTLLVVEHDREVIEGSDYLCDFGPGAGRLGGEIVAQGSPAQIARRRRSVTGPYLNAKKSIEIPSNRRPVLCLPPPTKKKRPASGKKSKRDSQVLADSPGGNDLIVRGARHNNLKNIDVRFPLGTLTAVTGPSGSGKSSLIEEILYASLARTLHRANTIPGAHDKIEGIEFINKVIRVDQTPLGNSPTSNPATYTGVFELIRMLFAQLPESKLRGYSPRRFSFNVPGGRCDECEGNGQNCIEMHFLPDVWVECQTCGGHRYNPETLAVKYRGRSISDVLEMTCGESVKLFHNLPKIRRILQTLCDVGLDYLTLGQSAPTLSGGEAQRVKLAAELARPDTGRTLYLLDEPTTGLHFDDLKKLLSVLQRLVDLGNTVVVIEHNLDVIKQADWLIDMGPEAGSGGGTVVAEGTPEDICNGARQQAPRSQVASNRQQKHVSHTAIALAPLLSEGPYKTRVVFDPTAQEEERPEDLEITDVGKNAKMPWETNGHQWHCQDRVDRKGKPCCWDGRILDEVVNRIQELGTFKETDWNARSVVEITAAKKSDGWFFHAITAETWLLRMKFRVSKNTFKRTELLERLPLKTLNQMDSIPMYSNASRVKCKSLRGPFQEIEIRAFSYDEINTPEFWRFVEEAVVGFRKHTERLAMNINDHMPWKKLGQKWHFLHKGFPPGKTIRWDLNVLEELYELLHATAANGQFLWNNQQLVHLYCPGQREPWATLRTKRPDSLDLTLNGPKDNVAFGRVADLGWERNFDGTDAKRDVVVLRFRTIDDLQKGDLAAFLKEHLNGVLKATP